MLDSPNPVAVPLLAIVAPDGTVIVLPLAPSVTLPNKLVVAPVFTETVSPELPSSYDVPDCGSNLSTNKVPIILPLVFLPLLQC